MSAVLSVNNQNQNAIRVVFSNRGLSEVITSPVDLSSNTPDAITVFAVSNIFSDLQIPQNPPFGFNSLKELVGIHYVGYIIDKERLDQVSGNWIRIDEYKIIGSQTSEFKDSRVAYGNIYRYRIRSIVKLTLPVLNQTYDNLSLQQDLKNIETAVITDRINILNNLLGKINAVTNTGLSAKTSQGSAQTIINIINGLQIIATARNISTNLTAPPIPTSLASTLRSSQNSNFDNLALANGTININDLQRQLNESIKNFISQVIQYKSFYYASETCKRWVYVPVTRFTPPDPPSSIMIIPNSITKKITVTWLPPPSAQKDIKFVRVYKKNNINDPWRLISQNKEVVVDSSGAVEPTFAASAGVPNSINLFVDSNVLDSNKKAIPCIYALTSVDVHGIESALSAQIQAQINDRFVVEMAEKPLKWISGSGALPREIGTIYKKFVNKPSEIIAYKNIVISPDVTMSEATNNLLIRITNLDTHEVKELKVVLNNLNISGN